MTVYPSQLDDDRTIVRIDDNLSELGTSAINQLREAVFAIERSIGVNPQGSKNNLTSRLAVSINSDGTINTAALTSVGLATLPIDNTHVASNAGIKETKLDLNFSTSNLNTKITSLESQVSTLQTLTSRLSSDLLIHISGGALLSDFTTQARHVASHIDINATPSDSRDLSYTWSGLTDKDGVARTATHVAAALLEINDDFVDHQNSVADAHVADAISVDATNFTSLPTDLEDVQEALNFIDNQETVTTGVDRATLHSNGVLREARSQDLEADGYGLNIIPTTPVEAFLFGISPTDSVSIGDDIIRFVPTDNSDYSFDAKFSKVGVGDIIRIDYGSGVEGNFPIKAIQFTPGSEWIVRINTYNLENVTTGGVARIDRARFDENTWGVLAAAGAEPDVFPDVADPDALDSIILGNPRGAVAVGLGFDPNKLDSTHYNLYLRMYPTGDPDSYVDLPVIDVTGNAGTTPGKYTLDRIIEETNRQFRQAGYNYRFIAFNHKGEFGLMLSDSINGASFSIISSRINGLVLEEGPYLNNVVGDVTDGFDALGFGSSRTGFASPILPASASYSTAAIAAAYSTNIISPVRDRTVLINGTKRDLLGRPSLVQSGGYWNASITDVQPLNGGTNVVEYTINLDLRAEELKAGKTLVVQPVSNSDLITYSYGYGRFIIADVVYVEGCDGYCQTKISVINAVHATAVATGSYLPEGTNVRIYFSEDSVSFNVTDIVGDSGDYHRYHEVFVDNLGESFSVGRARMPQQVGTSTLLDTQSDGWRIRQISPKLKGYRTGSEFRYYLRFVITNYNSTTGEYDGYIGEPSGNSIINYGPISRGRKEEVIRYYDDSHINFIDIEFREDLVDPGTTISSAVPRFVDIEVFSSITENSEYFLVAGVSHTGKDFKSITDLREFGTLSEVNFTDSAIDFIEAGEKYLHKNGVIRGFEYLGLGDTDDFTLRFSGGLALVNGSFVAVDTYDVKLPEIKISSSAYTQCFICVNKDGKLIAVINEDDQFFEYVSGYFVTSSTFPDLINKRKDLTIIAVTEYRASDVTPTTTDARRFIYESDNDAFSFAYVEKSDGTTGIDLEDGYHASFRTTEALRNWNLFYDVRDVDVLYVKVLTSLELRFSNPVVLKGGIWEVCHADGVKFLTGNWIIKDSSVFYYPNSGSFVTNDIFNVSSGEGCFVVPASGASSSIEDFGIENTTFYSNATQRPPFVAFYGTSISSNRWNRGRFIGNRFTDASLFYSLIYAFVNTGISGTSNPTMYNVTIADNITSENQCIFIGGLGDPGSGDGEYDSFTKVSIQNVVIRGNTVGGICTLVSGESELLIEDNDAKCILSGITGTMHTWTTLGTYGLLPLTGHTYSVNHVIRGNKSVYIKVNASTGTGSTREETFVTENQIERSSSADDLIDRLIPDISADDSNKYGLIAINATINTGLGSSNSDEDYNSIIISNNVIDGKSSGYVDNVWMRGGGTITGNIIKNIAEDGNGITIQNYYQKSAITGNSLHQKDGVTINKFINISEGANFAGISGNSFSHFDTTNNISLISSEYTSSNINQVMVHRMDLSSATPIFNLSSDTDITSSENEYVDAFVQNASGGSLPLNRGLLRLRFGGTVTNDYYYWDFEQASPQTDGTIGLIIPVGAFKPMNAYLLKFEVTVRVIGDWDVLFAGVDPGDCYAGLFLERNGTDVDEVLVDVDQSGDGVYDLEWEATEYTSLERPSSAYLGHDERFVVRIKQKAGSTYGRYAGPTDTNAYVQVYRPTLTWLF